MKKGFTLVELLGVIILLMVIFLLVFPATKLIINKSEDTVYKTQINKILKATYDYSLNNLSVLPKKGNKNYVTIGELIYGGYMDTLINPKTNEYFQDDALISIENVGSKYKNKSKNAIKYGDYLYKIEFDEMDSDDYIANKPKIVIPGIEKTSKGYTTILNQEETFVYVNPVIYNQQDVDITNNARVIKNILLDGKLVDSIDTSVVGIYSIKLVAVYTDINDKVYSSSEVWNVVITDLEIPVITLPDNNTISITDNTFDILNGVSCHDNSGECSITYTGSINFGIAGTNIIEYKATDKSGNVATATRVITVQ